MQVSDLPVLPVKPGCYLFYDPNNVVIYIGKAIKLRNRVRSYFNQNAERKPRLISQTAERLEFITTKDEMEALVLEANLIKEYKPHFNVRLKDDKHYPFLKLTKEDYPMLIFTRKIKKDGAQYFGPFPNAGSVRRVQELISSTFLLRENSGLPMKMRKKPCLQFHMKRCLAPCVDNTTIEEYGKAVKQVKAFLEGRVSEVIEELEKEMKDSASRKDFELAMLYRDRIQAVERLTGYNTNVVQANNDDLDFIGVAQAGNYAMVQLFQMRKGRVIGRDKRFLTNANEATASEIVEPFMSSYYGQATRIPPVILVPEAGMELSFWQDYLSEKAQHKVELRTPQRGEKVELMGMAQRNATNGLEAEIALLEKRGEAPGVKELHKLAELENVPYRIEGFDISNLMGTHTVASIVVFEGGRARKSEYRKMRITGLDKPDDFYSMQQVIRRRFSGSLADKMAMPDLLLIDGGKGQLTSARKGLKEAGVDIPMLGLAKKYETIIREGKDDILVPETHPALRLLIAIRDESHRTAVGFNRKERGKAMQRSVLDDIEGIGPTKRDRLLQHFSSIDEIKLADVEILDSLIGYKAAVNVKKFFEQY